MRRCFAVLWLLAVSTFWLSGSASAQPLAMQNSHARSQSARAQNVPATASRWHWLNPRPTGNGVGAVACAPGGACYGVGGNGTILMTNDRGRSWRALHSGTPIDLFDIACPATLICYAVGRNVALVTTDGGRTWAVHHFDPEWGVFSVRCPSSNRCYAMGTDLHYQCGSVACDLHGKENLLLRTDDMGRTWRRLNTGDTPGLDTLACPITRTCYLVGEDGTILVTRNAGATWQRLDTGIPSSRVWLTAVACVSTRQCLAGGDGLLLATMDYGATWTKVAAPPGVHFGFEGLMCRPDGVCLGVGSSEPPHHEHYRQVVVAISFQGSHVHAMMRGVVGASSIACANANDCIASGPAMSTDGGRHWREWIHGDRETFYQMVCVTSVLCHAVAEWHVLTTTNGGGTWTHRPPAGRDRFINPPAWSCPTIETCYAVGWRGTILRTDNGSRSWRREYTPYSGTGVQFNSLSCPARSLCFATGHGYPCKQGICHPAQPSQSEIVTTVDGGTHWQRLNVAQWNTEYFDAITCPSRRVCYVAGQSALVLKTTNGGRTWHHQEDPLESTSIEPHSIACPDVRTCYAVGYGCEDTAACNGLGGMTGGIIRTPDGGRTWRGIILPLPTENSDQCPVTQCLGGPNLTAIACPALNRCWIVGSGGTILETTDAGKTWQHDVSGTAANLWGIACPAVLRCYAVGDGGTILGLITGAHPQATAIMDSANGVAVTALSMRATASGCAFGACPPSGPRDLKAVPSGGPALSHGYLDQLSGLRIRITGVSVGREAQDEGCFGDPRYDLYLHVVLRNTRSQRVVFDWVGVTVRDQTGQVDKPFGWGTYPSHPGTLRSSGTTTAWLPYFFDNTKPTHLVVRWVDPLLTQPSHHHRIAAYKVVSTGVRVRR